MSMFEEVIQQGFNIPLEELEKRVAKICKEYGIVTDPKTMLLGGMDELFDKDGNLDEYGKQALEKGKKWFGDKVKEKMWAAHLGD